MNLKDQPLVSILMTAYNREQFITESIESVLASTYTNFELIIVDDCSVDRTVEIAREYEKRDSRIKLFINEQNLGDYPNRNKAASYANGKYLKYVDADDMIYSYTLDVLINFMEQFPNAGFGLSSEASEDKPFPICISPAEIYREHFAGFGHFSRSPGSAIIKRDAFNDVKGFSGKRMIGDYEFWFKISRYYYMVKYPHGIYWNRQHPQQESKSAYAVKNYKILMARVLEEALDHKDLPLSKEYCKMLIKKNKPDGILKKVWKKIVN